MPIEIDDMFKDMIGKEKASFVSILHDNFDTIAERRGWNAESTKEGYARAFNRNIMTEFNPGVSLAGYDYDHYLMFVDSLRQKHCGEWSEAYIERMEYLFLCVYYAGVELGLYTDAIFAKTRLDLNGNLAEKKTIQNRKDIFSLRKSLSVEENLKILKWIKALDPCTCSGLDIGIMLMFFTGMRNNEACGLSYGDISTRGEKEVPTLKIVRSTKIKSSEVKIGGKTVNASRVIPIVSFLYGFLIRRKRYLEEDISITDIDSMPIVSLKDGNRADTDSLTLHSKDIFRQLGIYANSMAIQGIDLSHQEMVKSCGYDIPEKDLTAYVMRRNFATMIHSIGLSDSESQYIFGHAVEDERRHYNLNDDRLFSIYRKLESHPLVQIAEKGEACKTSVINTVDFSKFVVRAEAKEPFEEVDVECREWEGKRLSPVERRISLSFSLPSGAPDILKEFSMRYNKAWKEMYKEE